MSVDLKQFKHHVVPKSESLPYRESSIAETYSRNEADAQNLPWRIKNVDVCVARLLNQPGWHIIPLVSDDDDIFTPLGPFPTINSAITTVILMNES